MPFTDEYTHLTPETEQAARSAIAHLLDPL